MILYDTALVHCMDMLPVSAVVCISLLSDVILNSSKSLPFQKNTETTTIDISILLMRMQLPASQQFKNRTSGKLQLFQNKVNTCCDKVQDLSHQSVVGKITRNCT